MFLNQLDINYQSYFKSVYCSLPSQLLNASDVQEHQLLFTYGVPDYKSYLIHYRSSDWMCRKFVAIPSAFLAGVVKLTYHLVVATILGIRQFTTNYKSNFRSELYSAARDVEEALGWLTTLFHDSFGSYLVQESLFQKACYENYEKSQRFSELNGEEIKSLDLSRLEEHHEAIITEEQVNPSAPSLSPESICSLPSKQLQGILNTLTIEQLLAISDDQLKDLDLKPLSQGQVLLLFEYNKAQRIQLLSTEQLQGILDKLGMDQLNAISDDKIKELDLSVLTASQINILFFYEDKRPLQLVSQSQLRSMITKFTELYHINGIPDELLKGLDMSLLTDKQLEHLVALDRCVKLLSGLQIQNILSRDNVAVSRYYFFSNEQCKEINLSQLDEKALERLFYLFPMDSYQKKIYRLPSIESEYYVLSNETIVRFSLYPSSQIQSVLWKLPKYMLEHISDEQLKEINFSDCSNEEIKTLFFNPFGRYAKKLFALVSPEQVNAIYQEMPKKHLFIISGRQINSIDLSYATKRELEYLFPKDDPDESKRFKQLSMSQFLTIYRSMPSGLFKWISDEQFQKLDLSSLCDEDFEWLFSRSSEKTARRRLALLSREQFQKHFSKFSFQGLLNIFSLEHFQWINGSFLTKDQICSFCNSCLEKGNKGNFAFFSALQVQQFLPLMNEEHLTLITDEQRAA